MQTRAALCAMLCSYLPASVLADPNGRQRFQTLLKENLALIDLAKPLTKGTSPFHLHPLS